MTHVMVATFDTEADSEHALQTLFHRGAPLQDACVLEAGPLVQRRHERGLLAIRTGPGHVERQLADAVVLEHGGQMVSTLSQSRGALDLIQRLPRARDAYQPPEAILPALLVTAVVEQGRSEQPDLRSTSTPSTGR